MEDIVDIEDLFGKVEGLPEKPKKVNPHTGHSNPPGTRGASWGRRNRLEIAKRDAVIAAMYAAGEYLEDIAHAVGFRQAGDISQSIQRMIQHWRKASLESISEKQAKHLAGLDALEQELFAAWRESRRGRMVKVSESVQNAIHNMHRKNRRHGENGKASNSRENVLLEKGQNVKSKMYERLESSAGDPRYMALILDIRKERAKIWGLYAKDQQGAGPGAGGYDPESLAQLDKSQLLARFMTLIESVKMERARKLAQGVEVDISPRAMITAGSDGEQASSGDEF